jgi:hypothetical protein
MLDSGSKGQRLRYMLIHFHKVSIMTTSSLILHGVRLSGHCHRVELFLNLLGLPYEYSTARPRCARRRPSWP